MPNRYEREIEEILRNLEHTEPKPGKGQKSGERPRRKSGPTMRIRQPRLSLHLSLPERLLLLVMLVALIGGGYAYVRTPDVFSLVLAVVGVICLILLACSQFILQPRRPRPLRYGNLNITPMPHRNPLVNIKTRWNLFKLKMRYRRKDGR